MEDEQYAGKSQNDESFKQGEGDEQELDADGKPKGRATFREVLTRWGAAGTVAANVASMAITSSSGSFSSVSTGRKVGRACVYASGGIACGTSTAAVYQGRQMTKGGTLRGAINDIRFEANRLTEENNKLNAEIDELEKSAGQLEDIEAALDELATVQGNDVNQLLDLVKENKEIAREMRAVLKARALEEIVTVVMDSDTDGDFCLTGKEIDELILKMGVMEELEFDENRFRSAVVKEGGSLMGILDIVKSLMMDGDDGSSSELGSIVSLKNTNAYLESARSNKFASNANRQPVDVPPPVPEGEEEDDSL